MKVLYLAHSGAIQGSGKALLNIVQGMVSQGVEVIAVLPERGVLYDLFVRSGVKCYTHLFYNEIFPRCDRLSDIVLYLPRLVRTLVSNKTAESELRNIIRRESPDIIHTNTGVIRFGSRMAERFHIPHVWHIREFQAKEYGFRPFGGKKALENAFSGKNNHCVAITKSLFDYFDLKEPKDQVIYDGVFSRNAVFPVKCRWKEKYFLFVGALERGKGIYDVLDAFDNIYQVYPDFELWLAGKDYINIAKEIGRRPSRVKIKYLGFRADVFELMSGAAALLVTSLNEGFGFITTEAMLNRCLVIGRNNTGTKEQFDNGVVETGKEIGLRFDSTEELTEKMKCVCESAPVLFNGMKDRAFSVVVKLYSTQTNTESLVDLYNRIIRVDYEK